MRRLGLAAVTFVVLAWNAALVAAPASAPPTLSAATYLAGSLVCHQLPERSFHHAGAQYPVCARCLGLYLGAGIGVLAWAAVAGTGGRPRASIAPAIEWSVIRPALLIAALPTLLTVALAWTGAYDASNTLRALFALPLGAATAAIVAAVAAGDLR